VSTFCDQNTTSNAQDILQIQEDISSSHAPNHNRNSYLLLGPKELPKFFDALSEPFRDNDAVLDPSGELRADASGRVALVQEYESCPVILMAYRTAWSGLELAIVASQQSSRLHRSTG
jgi:hypothetical protein